MSAPAPRIISDLSQLAFDDKHIKARKATIHQTDEVQVNIYVLQPQGRIPAHRHSRSWDISVVLNGVLTMSVEDGGDLRRTTCHAGAVSLVPPGTLHEVSNPSNSEPATFLLVQSPSKDFDFLPFLGPQG